MGALYALSQVPSCARLVGNAPSGRSRGRRSQTVGADCLTVCHPRDPPPKLNEDSLSSQVRNGGAVCPFAGAILRALGGHPTPYTLNPEL